jgi:diketogulonate reductase-like aldo/keto reductase
MDPSLNAHAASPIAPLNGIIPALGFGTSPMTGGNMTDAVAAALKTGYRHIDTARKYGTEGASSARTFSSPPK